MPDFLKIIAALINIAFGLWSVAQPNLIGKASGWTLDGSRGRAELRIAFGGYFIGMGLAVLLIGDPLAYRAVGAGWLGAAVVRGLTLAVEDAPALLRQPSYIGIWVTEIVVGLIMVI